jgi:hypothetical protein
VGMRGRRVSLPLRSRALCRSRPERRPRSPARRRKTKRTQDDRARAGPLSPPARWSSWIRIRGTFETCAQPGGASAEGGGGNLNTANRTSWRCALETLIGIAALLVGAGVGWLCFAVGVYFLTRTGREGLRIQRMADERRQRLSPEE